MPDSRPVSRSVCCASCPVWKGECPKCGTFWWTRNDGKRYGMRPATKQDAASIRALQTRKGYTAYPVVWDELPNSIGPVPLTQVERDAGLQ